MIFSNTHSAKWRPKALPRSANSKIVGRLPPLNEAFRSRNMASYAQKSSAAYRHQTLEAGLDRPVPTVRRYDYYHSVATCIALDWIGQLETVNWVNLSNVGQAYGTISAVLAGLALASVSYSMILQRRDTLAQRQESQRNTHLEISHMALGDPMLLECWGKPSLPASRSPDQFRQHLYCNLLFSTWQTSFKLGTMTSEELSLVSSQAFLGRPALRFWAAVRDLRPASYADDKDRRFHILVDEQYFAAKDRIAESPDTSAPTPGVKARRNGLSPMVAGIAIGLLFSRILRSRTRNRT